MAPPTPFAELIDILKPGATGSDMVELLDGKAPRTRALDWKAGRYGPPAWAIDLLRTKLRQRHEKESVIAARVMPGPGLKAGAINLARYRARSA